MWPDFRQIKRIVRCFFSICFRHDLNLQIPLRIVTILNGTEELLLKALTALADDFCRLCIRIVPVSLTCLEVELHPVTFTIIIPETECMGTVTVHVHGRDRQPSVGKENGDLMQTLRTERPEIPHRSEEHTSELQSRGHL